MNQVGHLSELHQKYFDRGLRVIAISDESEGLLQSKVVEERGGTFWMGSDPGGDTVAGFIEPGRRGIPHSYIVDASGIVVGEGIPDEATLEGLLKETFDSPLGRELSPALKSLVRHYEKGNIGAAWSGTEKYAADEDRAVADDAQFLRGKCEAYANFLRKLVEDGVTGRNYVTVFDDLKTLRKDFSGMEVSDWAEAREKELNADPAVKDEVKAWEAYEKAQQAEAKAGGKEKKLGAARTAYRRLLKKYPETRGGKMAEEALRRIGE